MTVTEAWLRRTSLAYHAAFDFCAVRAARAGGPIIVLASSAFYARELVRRLDDEVLLYLPGHEGLEQSETRMLMGPELDWGRVRFYQEMQPGIPSGMLLWAEPDRGTWPYTHTLLTQLAPTVTQVCVLGTTALRRVLREWQGDSLPTQAPFDSNRRITRALSALHFVEADRYGFHNPLSLAWSFAGRFAAAIGRADLVDRCSAAMQNTLVVRGGKAVWAPVWVVTASKDGNRD